MANFFKTKKGMKFSEDREKQHAAEKYATLPLLVTQYVTYVWIWCFSHLWLHLSFSSPAAGHPTIISGCNQLQRIPYSTRYKPKFPASMNESFSGYYDKRYNLLVLCLCGCIGWQLLPCLLIQGGICWYLRHIQLIYQDNR